MVNFVRLEKTAKRLIEKNGREVTFRKVSREAADPNKPWNGPAKEAPPVDVKIKAVFVPSTDQSQYGLSALGEGILMDELFRKIELFAMFSPGQHKIDEFTSVIDNDGVEYGVIAMQLLKPADIPIIAYLGLRR